MIIYFIFSLLYLVLIPVQLLAEQRGHRAFATQYNASTELEVALPHVSLKGLARQGRIYSVRITYNARTVEAPVKEVGPWNFHDNYWDVSRDIYPFLCCLSPNSPQLALAQPNQVQQVFSGTMMVKMNVTASC